MKTLLAIVASIFLSASAVPAWAALSFGQSIAGAGVYVAPDFSTSSPTLAYVATDSVTNIRLAPLGASGSYLALSNGGMATVDLGGASSFSFLWGSPDVYNLFTVLTSTGTESFGGLDLQSLFGVSANGDNAGTRLFSIAGAPGQTLTSITFASEGNAFELAVAAPVPEPDKYAMLLAGLAIVLFVGRRLSRRRRD